MSDASSTSGKLIAWAVEVLVKTPWYVPGILACLVTTAWIILIINFHRQLGSAKQLSVSDGQSFDFKLLLESIKDQAKLTQIRPTQYQETSLKGLPRSNKSVSYFSNLFRSENSIFADAAYNPHINTVVETRCYIQADNITKVDDGSFTVGAITEEKDFFICRFSIKHENYLARAENEKLVKILGFFAKRSGSVVFIDSCRPVND